MGMSRQQGGGLLLSLRPKFADAIMEGHKTIELRRTRPRIASGSLVILYASAPRMAVVALARVSSIIEDEPANLWRDHEGEFGLGEEAFHAYFQGASTAYGLRIQDVTELTPLPLAELRALGVEPPQSWRYLDRNLLVQISSGLAG